MDHPFWPRGLNRAGPINVPFFLMSIITVGAILDLGFGLEGGGGGLLFGNGLSVGVGR